MMDIPESLRDLRPVGIEDHAIFQAAVPADRKAWTYYFPFIHLYGATGRRWIYLYEQAAGSIILYELRDRRRGLELSLVVPPLPLTDEALRHAEERVRGFNAGRRWGIQVVQESDALLLARRGLTITYQASEYIYDRAAALAAEGPTFARLRKELSRARKQGVVETRAFTPEDRPACQAILEAWKRRLAEADIRPDGYRSTSHCLAVADQFPPALLSGLVVEVDGQIHGFAFAGRMNEVYGNLYVGMTDNEFRGLPTLLAVELMAGFEELSYFNDATDNGRPGLREQKQQFRPVEMHHIYRARAA